MRLSADELIIPDGTEAPGWRVVVDAVEVGVAGSAKHGATKARPTRLKTSVNRGREIIDALCHESLS